MLVLVLLEDGTECTLIIQHCPTENYHDWEGTIHDSIRHDMVYAFRKKECEMALDCCPNGCGEGYLGGRLVIMDIMYISMISCCM